MKKLFLQKIIPIAIIVAIYFLGALAFNKLDKLENKAEASYTPVSVTAHWVKVTKTYADFAIAGPTNDISVYTLPSRGYIHDIKIIPSTAFSGGLISAYTVSVGPAGSLTKYAVATNVFTGNTTLASIHTPLVGLESTSGTTDIRAQAIATTGLLDAATAGVVDFYFLVSTLP